MKLPSKQELYQIADETIGGCTVFHDEKPKSEPGEYLAKRLYEAAEAVNKKMPAIIDEIEADKFWGIGAKF